MKHKYFFKILVMFLCFSVFFSAVYMPVKTNALTLSELEQQQKDAADHYNNLKSQKADQEKLKAALDERIAATQAIIDSYNQKISEYNSQINQKQNEIDEMNEKIEEDKTKFKTRIRSIYMSNTQSSAQILLGADNFSDYLVLAQMAKSVSAHDKSLIEKIIVAVSYIEAEQTEIQKLLEEQKSAKAEIDKQKADLDEQVAEIQGIIKGINRDMQKDLDDMAKISDEIDKKKAESVGGGGIASNGGLFLWPSASFFYISAGFDSGDSVHNGNHKGIDIAGGGIGGTPVRAAASGTVYLANNSCTHNYSKYSSCGCGGGYGNYVAIDHGPYNGNSYKTLYAHMKNIVVSVGQYVERGQTIGYVGTTGWSTGNHIHFETILNNKKVNPKNFSYDY